MSRAGRPGKPPEGFGAILRAYRDEMGLSQTQLGELLGASQSQVSRLEARTELTPGQRAAVLLDRWVRKAPAPAPGGAA